jgi:hypothetical protein
MTYATFLVDCFVSYLVNMRFDDMKEFVTFNGDASIVLRSLGA